MKTSPYEIPESLKIRVIIDTDCNCEADDQYALAHALMTPKFDVRGVVSAHYLSMDGTVTTAESEELSYQEAEKVIGMMELTQSVRAFHGCTETLPDDKTFVESEGARFIVEEALRDDPRPLFVCNQGAITDLASAYLMEPRIAEKVKVIWIGGGAYPAGGFEFNQNGDINAARVIFKSNMELWQVPANVYTTMRVSFFELMNHVHPCGELGKYLVENTQRVSNSVASMMDIMAAEFSSMSDDASYSGIDPMAFREGWSLGDSPCVGLMMKKDAGTYHMEDAPHDLFDDGSYDLSVPGSRKIRVYDSIDSRFIINDMFEKLKYYFG